MTTAEAIEIVSRLLREPRPRLKRLEKDALSVVIREANKPTSGQSGRF
ncbi:unnamed protein product [marine sediment metagenome]|uniref:Uncharacterized protein n=1 Tax=marine sediment metagenome TaxID=412755 RepID=X1NNU2_9ZZZZ